jgi:hypothetical protein
LRPALQHRSDEDDDSQNEEAGDVSGGRRRRRVAERSTQHSPTGEKIAKDTGCCLYSAISVVVVMLVGYFPYYSCVNLLLTRLDERLSST